MRTSKDIVIMLILLLTSLVGHSLALLTDPALQVDSGFNSLSDLQLVPPYPLPDGESSISDPTVGSSISSSEFESPEFVSQPACHAPRNSKLRVRYSSSSDQAGKHRFLLPGRNKGPITQTTTNTRSETDRGGSRKARAARKGRKYGYMGARLHQTKPQERSKSGSISFVMDTQTRRRNSSTRTTSCPDSDRLKCKFLNYKICVYCSGPPEPPTSTGPMFTVMKNLPLVYVNRTHLPYAPF